MNKFFKNVLMSIATLVAVTSVFAQDANLPQSIEGRYTNKVTGNSNSFSMKEIKAEGENFEALFTLWGSNNCGARNQKVKGLIQGGIATFNVSLPVQCTSEYVATIDFGKKVGTYKTIDYNGTYEFK